MDRKRYVIMGAGQVGFYLARSLSQEGYDVAVIEQRPATCEKVGEDLDVLLVQGNGARISVLESAGVKDCELFMAVSSNEEANLAASLLAKRLGARRSAVRVETAGYNVVHRKIYEEVFKADLLLSTQVLTTTRILNQIRGLSTVAVEHFAGGKVQLRKVHLDKASALTRAPLNAVDLPESILVAAFFRGEELIIPTGEDRAQPGDDALIIGEPEAINDFERKLNRNPEPAGTVVIAGGGPMGTLVAEALSKVQAKVKIIEENRERARKLAERFPNYEIIQGDATDLSLLRSERISDASCFIALTGHDETNLMASLLAQELEVPQVVALVHRAETSHLWRRLGLVKVFSPRALAKERIYEYIESGYSANIVSLKKGAAQFAQRRLFAASPAAGVSLAEINPPRGLIVAAVVRGDRVFVPRGKDRLKEGDVVILFVSEEELETVQLLFPGKD